MFQSFGNKTGVLGILFQGLKIAFFVEKCYNRGMKRKAAFASFLLLVLIAALSACGIFGAPRVVKADLSAEMVRYDFAEHTYMYSGRPIEPFSDPNIHVDGRYVSYEYFDITFSDNVNVGTATVTITAVESSN